MRDRFPHDFYAPTFRELMKFAANGTLYRGSKPVMWSVVEKTALAEAEVEYEDYTSDTVWVKFPVSRAALESGANENDTALAYNLVSWGASVADTESGNASMSSRRTDQRKFGWFTCGIPPAARIAAMFVAYPCRMVMPDANPRSPCGMTTRVGPSEFM